MIRLAPRGVLALALLGAAAALPALAEPAFAVRTGHRCSECHVNRTGGGMRTPYGSLYGQAVLPAWRARLGELGGLLPADPGARFAAGADARVQYVETRKENAEDPGSFEVGEANLYLEGRLLPRRLSVYLDETVGPGGASARELFGLLSFGEKRNGYLKAGKFLPPYGFRLPDDEAYIRQYTGFTYSAPDVGLELGFEPGRWSLALAAVNGAGGGSDDNQSKKFTLRAERRMRNTRLGVSGANNIAADATTNQAGIFGGLNVGRLGLLGEADWVETSADADATTRLVALIEADLLIARGVALKLAHDWIDPDRDVATDARVRDSLGLELVPLPFVRLRTFVRRGDGPPQVAGSRDEQVELELHLYF